METLIQERVVDRDEQLSHQENDEWHVPKAEKTEVDYPESDGEPMGETGFHVGATLRLYDALCQFFSSREDIYVAADMFLYYEEGNRYANKAPDVMVIKGVDKHVRRTFKIWEERAAPCVIFEITSKSTMAIDMVTKSALYATLGVREYFLFDPLHEYLEDALLGFRLENSEYVTLSADKNGRLFSEELGVLLSPENEFLRVIDPQTGKPVPSFKEAMLRAEQEAQRAEQEAQRAEQETQRAEQEAQRAEQEAQRAEQEAQRAEQETQRAERLAAQLRAMGIEPDA